MNNENEKQIATFIQKFLKLLKREGSKWFFIGIRQRNDTVKRRRNNNIFWTQIWIKKRRRPSTNLCRYFK